MMENKEVGHISVSNDDAAELSDFLHFCALHLNFRGVDADGGQAFLLTIPKHVDFWAKQKKAVEIADDILKSYVEKPAEPEKPKPSYCEKVFDLLLSKPIPGVASIEVNESQRKFVVQYDYPMLDRDPGQAPNVYSIDDLRKEWAAYIFVLNGNGGNEILNSDGELAGFRSFIEFLLTPHEVLYADDAIFNVCFNDKEVKP